MTTEATTSRQLGKYRLLGRIGYGGMAEVWVAHQQGPMGFEKLVAIKRLLPHMENQRNFVRMFLDEARIAARINHANVVQIFDLGLVDQKFYIAMEYLPGESLARIMGEGIKRDRPLPTHVAAMIISQICKGLHHAHQLNDNEGQPLGIVHRDVSPQNVMVLYDGGVKLLDFGIAKARERLSETTTTGMKGKYAYMSPEQCQGDPVDRRSDIFATGTVLWEILARRRLFKHASKLMMLKMISEGHAPPPSKMNPDVPPEIDAICLKALRKLPSERYATALELSTAIDEYLVTAGIASSVVQIGEYMEEVFSADKDHRTAWISSAASSTRDESETLQSAEHWLDLIPDADDTIISFSKSPVGTSVGRPLPRQSPVWWIATAVVAILAAVAAITLLVLSPSHGGSRLRVASTPPGAMIVIDGKLQEARTPGTITDLAAGALELEVVLEGHLPWRREVQLGEGETLRVEAALRRRPGQVVAARSRDAAAPPGRPDARVGGKVGPRRPPDAATAAAPASSPVSVDARTMPPMVIRKSSRPQGYLNLATVPWATIYHRRRRLGNTPLVRARLPAGRVTLRAVNRGQGINTTFTVEIRAGRVTRQSRRLR
jgi:serine/threonine-protein kinase